MSVVKKSAGAALALAAAGLVGCAMYGSPDNMASASNDVHCYGVNKCKGMNDCKTANNACKGHGSCKGKGFVAMSASACDKLGGKVGK